MATDIVYTFQESGPQRSTTLFDPSSVDKVETHEKGSSTIIESVTSFSNPETGVYIATLEEEQYDENTDYRADWYWTDGSVQHSRTEPISFSDFVSQAEATSADPSTLEATQI